MFVSVVGKVIPKNGLGSTTRCVALNETDTVTVLPNVHGLGFRVLVRYLPEPVAIIGDATETM